MSDDRCNCPPMRDVFREGVGTKPPCPVHDTPERLAALAEMIQPAVPMADFSFQTFSLPARKARRS